MSNTTRKQGLVLGYWALVLILAAGATAMTFAWTPVEQTMGPVQKIFYIHLPVAICTFFAFMTCFVGSIGYLYTRKRLWDDLALAGAQVGVAYCTVVLLTGMFWGKAAWGVWWTWSPRLTFSLVLWLLYVVYLLIRPPIASPPRRALVASVYGLVAFLDVPLVYFSTKLMADIHPTSVSLEPSMQLTLLVWFVPVVLTAVGLVVARYQLGRRQARIEASRYARDHESVLAPEGVL